MAETVAGIAELLTDHRDVVRRVCNYCLRKPSSSRDNPMLGILESAIFLEQNYNQSLKGVMFSILPQYLDYRSRRVEVLEFKKALMNIVTKENIEDLDKISCLEKIRDFIKKGNWYKDSSANNIFMTELIKKAYGVHSQVDIEYIKTWLEELAQDKKIYWALKNTVADISSFYRYAALNKSAPV